MHLILLWCRTLTGASRSKVHAGVAQLAERLICNQNVGSSSLPTGTI
jgi:hypothetical protein